MDEKQTVTTNDTVENKEVHENEQEKQQKENVERMIPKQRFDEVNNKLKELTKFKEEFELKVQEEEKRKMFESGKQEEFYKTEIEKLNSVLKQKEEEVLNVQKSKIIDEYKIPETFAKFIVGQNIDEIKSSAEAISKELENAGLIKKQEDFKNKIDTKSNENKNKSNSGILTREDISKMSTKEYNERKEEIHSLLREGKIK